MATPTTTNTPTLKLTGKPLALAFDGHTIMLKDDGTGEVVLFQITDQAKDGTIEATGFCTIRINVKQLKTLSDAILATIRDHEIEMSKRISK